MKIYIHLALLPTLMMLDYFLTIWSQKLARQTWRKHYIIENFELNPIFQEAVSQERWFNPSHLIRATLTSSLFILAVVVFDGQDNVAVNFGLGALLMMFCLINANHVRNVLLFRYVNRNPSQLSGTITMSHELSLHNSDVLYRSMLVPLVLIAFTFPSPFAFGTLLSPLILYVHHRRWKAKYRKENPR